MIFTNPLAETARANALKRYRFLDVEGDAVFGIITSLAAQILSAPIALLTIFDTDRIWYLSAHGIQPSQLNYEEGLFASDIREDGLYLVEDAQIDSRTCDHSFVTGQVGLRFYAGMPFSSSEGYRLGTLCVMDTVPRKLSTANSEVLRNLTVLVMKHMELLVANMELCKKAEDPSQIHPETDQLLLTAIHDIRTPLSTITMLSSLLGEQQVGGLNDGQAKMVHSICTACKEMASQLTHYAEYVSCDPSQLYLEKHLTDIAGLVQDCITEQEFCGLNSKVTIDFNSQIGLPSIYVDGPKIRKVISTFLNYSMIRSNYTDRIGIEIKSDESNLWINFCDQGSFMTPAQIDLIFNATSGHRGNQGKGNVPQEIALALSIAKRLIAAHQGGIDVVGNTNGGLIFSLRLPLQ